MKSEIRGEEGMGNDYDYEQDHDYDGEAESGIVIVIVPVLDRRVLGGEMGNGEMKTRGRNGYD